MNNKLTHLNEKGDANMVDVGDKIDTKRTAIARGSIRMTKETFETVEKGQTAKGDVIATARIAGIMGAKKTSDLIPLCHPLMLTNMSIDILADVTLPGYHITAEASLNGKTGVEMEALTAVSITCLTLYDMIKALDKSMIISDICLVEKQGGKSGFYIRGKDNGTS
ncbi:cyclic pyranopterin monophosphate synthase MoaC [Bartonella tamiae]|uniref:Cyclic pyranopterin monophosphate synthase n=1 Tax=Bartonella tamiae Th239 TaxID=1094558 RepID=J0R4W0_9HYPH|nr:cyclic pyranopterin monophosphate synthase MoaC [Bartonella tamiae]EJF90709.1 molybdenum cofactor biosynthesis protein C [Bartonella tamiae Th239]EJF93914.1 molybdenum cofactor biosynthesis protein C [Bartonella tamiae Th307]